VRNDRFSADGARINARGGAISDVALGGAWYAPDRWYGFAGRLALERFGVRDEDPARPGTLALTGFEGSAGSARGSRRARTSRSRGSSATGSCRRRRRSRAAPRSRPVAVRAHGPVAAVSVNAFVNDWLALEATGRACR
jgi:hypothetical protein